MPFTVHIGMKFTPFEIHDAKTPLTQLTKNIKDRVKRDPFMWATKNHALRGAGGICAKKAKPT